MFYYHNGKLGVCAQTRCGSTSMESYFGFKPKTGKTRAFKPVQFGTDLIVVLRNPLDRMASAVSGITPEFVQAMLRQRPQGKATVMLRQLSSKQAFEFVLYKAHCMPYLENIINNDFRIIDFDKLHDYIPKYDNAKVSPTTNSAGYTDPREVYVQNNHFTLDDLHHEYDLYQNLLKDREHISVEEWREKTP